MTHANVEKPDQISAGRLTPSDEAGRALWNCRCSCGKEREVRANSLISGRARSCGCARPGRPRKIKPKRQPSVPSQAITQVDN
jgi:hypothetical protein